MNNILTTVIQVLIIPVITILAGYLVKFIKAKAESVIAKTENELVKEYLKEAADVISQAVAYTTQTYVDTLKKQDKFDAEAQSKAFSAAKEVALQLLTTEAKETIQDLYGDLAIWVDTKIEQTINQQKTGILESFSIS